MIGPSRHNSIRDGLELCDYFSCKGEIDTEIQIESLEADEGGKALNDLKFRFAKLQLALAYNIKEVASFGHNLRRCNPDHLYVVIIVLLWNAELSYRVVSRK